MVRDIVTYTYLARDHIQALRQEAEENRRRATLTRRATLRVPDPRRTIASWLRRPRRAAQCAAAAR